MVHCIGAVDWSHIPVFVNNRKRYINHKGYASQNILAVCIFNMDFTYVMPQSLLKILNGKWILGNAGFSLVDPCLIPYRGTKYHLMDWDVPGGTKITRNFTT
ncbi:hypothetical protein VP01_10243g1 [Puccinia sorghi]|uniref:DDE Tnp4 domain-containing protein n=1 Tax=Puccinia sorghi TaxID=27349 RepID=A0A0L6VV37_9BASI|nr:hypothetical protein VP01_10243g1 [Puccinia sorghi]